MSSTLQTTLHTVFFVLLIISVVLYSIFSNFRITITIRTYTPAPQHRRPSMVYSTEQEEKNRKLQNLAVLSRQFQEELYSLQHPVNCSAVKTLKCSMNFHGCGFGCHMHGRIKCLMLSYALGIPWINNEAAGWIYKDKWTKYLKPVWSSCPVNKNTIEWNWFNESIYKSPKYPLGAGLPVPRAFGLKVMQNHDFPFAWVVGQLGQYIFQLQDETVKDIQKLKRRLKVRKEDLNGQPLIGVHIRRTDKVKQHEAPLTPDAKYIQALENYRRRFRIQGNLKVYIASDTNGTLDTFREKLNSTSDWTIVGQQTTKGFDMNDRKGQLLEMIRDFKMLLDCDYVICTFSSSMGRMVMEINSQYNLKPSDYVESLDVDYLYRSHAHLMPTKLVLKK